MLLYLTTCIFLGLDPARDFPTQFTVFSGFIHLCLKLGCSWGFHTAEYTSECTPRCIFNVEIPQWSKQNFPLSPSFQRYSQDTFNASRSVQQELLFFFYITWGNAYTISKLLFLQSWSCMGASSSQGMFPVLQGILHVPIVVRIPVFLCWLWLWKEIYILTSILHEDKVDIFSENLI